jgi:hypothetical protein
MFARPPVRALIRCVAASAFIVLTFFSEPSINRLVRAALHTGRLMTRNGEHQFALLPFTAFLAIRLVVYVIGFTCVRQMLRGLPGLALAPMASRMGFGLSGLATGVLAMSVAILSIIALGGADLRMAQDHVFPALAYLTGWMVCSIIGAAAEEVFYRGMVLLTLDRIGGRAVAMTGSALAFVAIHTDNPGVSPLWLLRLFLQGLLLAYAVYRTGSLWWSIGYHAGWNFASAPLFGAAGSGYGAEGHLLAFQPQGPGWLTGNAVGPEGSIFAFGAMAIALGLLLVSCSRNINDMCQRLLPRR